MSRPLTILHLSDLHFGNKNRFAGTDPAKLAADFHHSLVEEMKHASLEPELDLVIVTGDFAEVGKPVEFKDARAFLDGLRQAAGLHPTRFVLLPGNHDINWNDCRNLRNDLDNGDLTQAEFDARLPVAKLRRYHDFVRAFYELGDSDPAAPANLALIGPTCQPLAGGGWLMDFPGLLLSVAALNSSEREDDQKPGGFLSEQQAQALMDAWDAPAEPRLRLIAVHHNPVATTEANANWSAEWIAGKAQTTGLTEDTIRHYTADLVGFTGRERLRAVARERNAHLLLHGHHHDAADTSSWPCSGDQHCAVLSAGSFGLKDDQLPGDAPLSCQVLRFDTGPSPRLRALPLVFDPRHRPAGKVSPGQFRLSPRSDAAYNKPLTLPDGWPTAAAPAPVHAGPSPALRQRLVALAITTYSPANLGGLYAPGEKDRSDDIRLADIFVEPSLARFHARPGRSTVDDARAMEAAAAEGQRVSAGGALEAPGAPAVILGEPGSGKTSLLHWHLLRQLPRWAADPALTFPVYLRLSVWEKDCPANMALPVYAHAVLAKQLSQDPADLPAGWLAEDRPVLWLLDGIDEVRDPHRRSQLMEELRTLPAAWPAHSWVVTSRPTGYHRGNLGTWQEWELAPLDNDQARSLLTNWSRLLEKLDRRAVFHAGNLFDALTEQTGLSRLRRNPLLLTMIVLFYRDSKRLPDHRWEFYEHAARALRRSWVSFRSSASGDGADETLSSVIHGDWLDPVLAHLAIAAMRQGEVVFSSEALRTAVQAALRERNFAAGEAETRAAAFMDRALRFIGVFVEKGTDRYGFLHLTFQEYYAAEWLLSHEPEAGKLIKSHWQHSDWQETWDLYALGLRENATKLDALHEGAGKSKAAMAIRLRWLGLGSAPFPETGPRERTLGWAVGGLFSEASGESSAAALSALARWERRYPPQIIQGLAVFLNHQDNKQAHEAAKALGEQAEGRELRAELLRLLCGPDTPEGHRIRGFAEYALTQKAESPRVRQGLRSLYEGHPLDCGTVPSREARFAAARALGGEVSALPLWEPPPVECRTVLLAPEVSMDFLLLPAGTLVGGKDGKHRVVITRPFWIARTPVTQAQWEAIMKIHISLFNGRHLPVDSVSWKDVAATADDSFPARLSRHPGYIHAFGIGASVSLPTEAQWEYACRAGTTTAFYLGASISSHQANFNGNYPEGVGAIGVYRARTCVVGSFPPNAWGLHDMHGNVLEWCQDFLADYPTNPPPDYAGPPRGRDRVVRGGGWFFDGRLARSCYRLGPVPYAGSGHIGFRPCAVPAAPDGL